MRKNKTFLGVALLVGILMLGVGYAAVIGNVNMLVNGTLSATTDKENFKVEITSAKASDGNNSAFTVTAGVDNTDKLLATLSVSGMTTRGQSASAEYTISNSSPELIASLTAGEVTYGGTNPEYFTVTTDLVSAKNIPAKSGETAGTVVVKVTVTMAKTPEKDVSATFSLPMTATAVAASN